MSLVPQALSADHFVTRVSSTPAASNRYMRSMASRLGRQEHSCMECNDRCRDFRFAKAGLRGVSTAAFSPAEGHIAMALEDAQRASGMLGAPKRLQFCSDTWPKSGRQTTTSMACASSPRHQTKRPAFGIPLREGRSRRCADTRVQYCRPLSTWTDRASSRRQKTRRPVFGTPRQEGRSRRFGGTRVLYCLLPSATTGRASSRRHQTRLRVPGMSAPQHCQPTNSRRGLHASIARTNHAQP